MSDKKTRSSEQAGFLYEGEVFDRNLMATNAVGDPQQLFRLPTLVQIAKTLLRRPFSYLQAPGAMPSPEADPRVSGQALAETQTKRCSDFPACSQMA